MSTRRQGRSCALQILYQLDVSNLLGAHKKSSDLAAVDRAIRLFWRNFDAEPIAAADRTIAERLVQGVAAHTASIDDALGEVSHHWRVSRMGTIERNILRLGAYEILYCPDIPRAATINEAVEVAKRFGGADSAAFVNGLLDQLEHDDDGIGAKEVCSEPAERERPGAP